MPAGPLAKVLSTENLGSKALTKIDGDQGCVDTANHHGRTSAQV